MRGILSPLSSGATGSALIERRPKRTNKVKLSQAKYVSSDSKSKKGRKPAAKFQKKLVVVDYMGPADAPRNFTVREPIILLRGMLPEIPVDASEREVRTYIRDTIKYAEDSLSGCLLSDFEYVEAHGKNLCVPAQQSDFEWTGRAVKELAGSGSIYVRLTTENADLCSPNSDYSVGSPVGSSKEPDVKIIKVEDAGM